LPSQVQEENISVDRSTARTSIRIFAGAQFLLWIGCGQGGDDRGTSWSSISATIVQPSCATANCHASITRQAGVDLSTIKEGYEVLLNGHYVTVGDPEGSRLVLLLRGVGSRRMPPDFALPNADIELIERWIAARAPYDGPGRPPVAP
jgi:hypothetical protein